MILCKIFDASTRSGLLSALNPIQEDILDYLNLEDEAVRLTRNVGKQL